MSTGYNSARETDSQANVRQVKMEYPSIMPKLIYHPFISLWMLKLNLRWVFDAFRPPVCLSYTVSRHSRFPSVEPGHTVVLDKQSYPAHPPNLQERTCPSAWVHPPIHPSGRTDPTQAGRDSHPHT